jgi:prepilin-type N-terminal cleavage/methylation domain-containing protein
MVERYNKKNGFTLLEVIISMTIIAIISVGIYTGYMMMIRENRDGQAKQDAALEGKKVAEALEADSFTVPDDDKFQVESMSFQKDGAIYERYLSNKYDDKDNLGNKITEANAKYIENVTFSPATAEEGTTSEEVALDTNNGLNSTVDKIYISREDLTDYISYLTYEDAIPLLNNSEIELSVYLTPKDGDSKNENINIMDYAGNSLITTTKSIDENLVINFSNYKNADGTLPSDENIEIDVYNKTSVPANIYLEKQTDLNVDVENRNGEVNLYNNRSENVSQDDIGTLYDITINITDKTSGNVLFTGYYKKNLLSNG